MIFQFLSVWQCLPEKLQGHFNSELVTILCFMKIHLHLFVNMLLEVTCRLLFVEPEWCGSGIVDPLVLAFHISGEIT